MAVLHVQEYRELAQDAKGYTIQAGKEPALATQAKTLSGSTQSDAFQVHTQFVRVVSDVACHLKFGVNPTATTSDMLIQAATVEFFAVIPDQKIAALEV